MHEAAHIAQHPLPALLALTPIVAAAAVYPLGRWKPAVRDAYVLLVTGLTLLGAAALIPLINQYHTIAASVPALLGTLNFTVDPYGMLFAVFTSFVWFCATLYSLDYLKHEKNHSRYHTVTLVVLGSMLGVVLAGDLITLYLFFELLGLVAFLFVIHARTDEAKRASIKYFWMTVVGGFMLVAGIFLTLSLGGDGTIGPLPLGEHTTVLTWITFALLIGGFGVKAGMVPLHIWLPDAHPVAPAPASALLSGVMIKAGAYGIFRTVTALFRPPLVEEGADALWEMTGTFGLVVLWIGIATMAIGVTCALGQHNAKRMLAYHSVSQMGFILAGIGAAGYLGTHGAMGLAGGLFHVVNHALFKAALFLGVGAVVFRTGELDMYKLGGLWRKMPLTFIFMLIAAAGITGIPLFNGFVSKCLIHHALVEAYEHHHLVSLDIAEKIYVVTCGGTAASFIKLIGFVFLGKPRQEYGPKVTDAPPRMLAGLGLLSVPIVALGVFPQILLKGVFAPGLHVWGLHSDLLDYFLKKYFLSPPDLLSAVTAYAIGITIFVVGRKFGLFHLHPPKWLGIDYWYGRLAAGFVSSCRFVAEWYRLVLAVGSRLLQSMLANARMNLAHGWHSWQASVDSLSYHLPGPRHYSFIRRADRALEHERRLTVREAVALGEEWLAECDGMGREFRQRFREALREVAADLAEAHRAQRHAVLAEMARTGEVEYIKYNFDGVISCCEHLRDQIGCTAVDLALQKAAGEDISLAQEQVLMNIGIEERFAQRLRDGAPTEHPHPVLIGRVRFNTLELASTPGLMVEWHTPGLGLGETITRYLSDAVWLVIEYATRQRTNWLVSDQLTPGKVLETRASIQRYARDMSFNVAAIIIVLVAALMAMLADLGD